MSTVESIARPRRNGERRDRKSGSAGMPRPISYAVFCLKKQSYVGEAEEVEEVTRARLCLLARRPGDHRRQRHVLENAHALEQVEQLEDDHDVLSPHARED